MHVLFKYESWQSPKNVTRVCGRIQNFETAARVHYDLFSHFFLVSLYVKLYFTNKTVAALIKTQQIHTDRHKMMFLVF